MKNFAVLRVESSPKKKKRLIKKKHSKDLIDLLLLMNN